MSDQPNYLDDDQVYTLLGDPRFWENFTKAESQDLVDFHETVSGAPFVWLLGRIVLDFNYAEHQLKALLWSYLGDSFETGHAITAAMGSSTVVDVLVSSAKRADEPGEILELVKFAGQCFDVCRNNRNSLAHSMTVEGRDDSTFWIRASRKSDYQQSQMKLKLEDLLRVSKEIASTATFILKLQMHRNYAIRGGPGELTLPDRFPMPLKLKSREVNIAVEAKKFGWDLKHK